MKAAFLFGLQDIRYVEVPRPSAGSDEILIRVDACGICPTDIRKYHTIYSGNLSLPENLGHEYVGTVVEIGDNVKNIDVGVRIVGDGFGGYAEYALLDLTLQPPLHIPKPLLIPQDVSSHAATFVEPLACCLHAILDQVILAKDQTVLIVGGGTMGQLMVMLAKHIGAKVILSEPYSARRDKAISLGADATIDPQEEKLAVAVKSLNNGEPVDSTILTIGNPKSVQDCIDTVKPCGKVVLFGRFPHGAKIEIDSQRIYRDEVQLLGSYWVGGDMPKGNIAYFWKALELIKSSEILVEKLISGVFPLHQIHKAFEAASSMDTYKIIVEPG